MVTLPRRFLYASRCVTKEVQSGTKPAPEGDVLHCFSGAFWFIIQA
jgi:hypothetical protein